MLFEVWWARVPIETGPPVPPVSDGPDAVAANDGVANKLLCVTDVDKG